MPVCIARQRGAVERVDKCWILRKNHTAYFSLSWRTMPVSILNSWAHDLFDI